MTHELQAAPVETVAAPAAPQRAPSPHAGARGGIGSGTAFGGEARASMELAFGHSFADIRIHADDRAAAAARDEGARAYTLGTHIVFGAGQYAPHSRAGRHLLAHELVHTLQQRRGVGLQRQAEGEGAPTDAAEREADGIAGSVTAPAGIVASDDAADVRPGQMRRREFLEAVRAAACAAADAELARAGRSTEGCPYVERVFETYRDATVERVNRSIALYVGAVESATTAVRAIADRVREGTRTWLETGQVPETAVRAAEPATAEAPAPEAPAETAPAEAPAVQAKLHGGGVPAVPPDAASVRGSLGDGTPLDAGVRSRMEQSFGFDFASVRLHTDSRAATTAARHDALALTVGHDIAFAPGEYRPGSLEGDALLAHELAHVVQQSGAASGVAGGAAAELEDDADEAAALAVAGAWAGVRRFARRAMPRLRSGVRLSRCSSCPKTTIIHNPVHVFRLAGAALDPRTDVPAASTVWQRGAGIVLDATYYPDVDEPTTRSLIGGDDPPGTPVEQLNVAVTSGPHASTTDTDNLARHAAAAGAGTPRVFYVPTVLFGGHTGPPDNHIYVATTCRAGYTLAHELGHIYLGAGHSGDWDSALMHHPEQCGSDAIDDLECRMARGEDAAWREYGRRRLPRS